MISLEQNSPECFRQIITLFSGLKGLYSVQKILKIWKKLEFSKDTRNKLKNFSKILDSIKSTEKVLNYEG